MLYFCREIEELMEKRRLIFLVITAILGLVIVGCGNLRNQGGDELESDSIAADSAQADTMRLSDEEELISETPMPTAADEFFDDFFFNFAANPKLQLARIAFPLTLVDNKEKKTVQKKQWKMDNFFMRQGYYTQIFDNQRQIDLSKESTVEQVILERIHLRSEHVQRYIFARKKGKWMLTEIRNERIDDNVNASFLNFYKRFVADSVFQIESLDDQVTFSSPSPDDEFETQSGEIVPEQWPMFKPELIPNHVIYNMIYDGQIVPGSNQKIFMIRGVANGMESQLVFKKKGGRWRLVEFDS